MTAKLFKLQFREVWRVIRILIPLTFLFILVTSAAALLRIGLLTGLLMTTAMRDTMYGDLISGIARALEALLLAVAVALGVYVGLSFIVMMGGTMP